MQPRVDNPEDFQEIELKEAQTNLYIEGFSSENFSNLIPNNQSTYINECGQVNCIDQPKVYSKIPQACAQGHVHSPKVCEQDQINEEYTQDEMEIIKFSVIGKYCALGNIAIDLLLALALPYLIVVLLVNMIGYCGARNYSKYLCVGYMIYVGLVVFARIFLMIYFPIVYVVVVFSVLVIIQVCVFGVFFWLTRLLSGVDSVKIQRILETLKRRKIEKKSFWDIFIF